MVYSATSTKNNPTIAATGVTPVAASNATGTFTVNASSLTPGTTYSYAAYVSTYYGTVYTTVSTFVTATVPTVTSPTATIITSASASLGGNVTSNGGATLTARGVVYSVNATNSNPIIGGANVTTLTDTNATTGTFTDSTGNNLASGTTYAYRVYATNTVGTAYTTATTFTTLSPPTANSQNVTVPFNPATAVTLTGSDSNTPAQTLTYTVVANPTHGNLQNAASVNFFHNLPGTGFTVVSPTQLTVVVPAGAKSGVLTVLSGSGSNTSSTKFIVTP